MKKWTALLAVTAMLFNSVAPVMGGIEITIIDSGPTAPQPILFSQMYDPGVTPQSAVMLGNVPTSSWTNGCSATSAGMMFGYYDRTGYSNMYAGPCNGGVAPLTNLGGQSSIISTRNGFDGRATNGHVDDYWIGTNSPGPDPWEGNWTEHTWGDCTADYMGTNQWKWDFSGDGNKDFNVDGSTALFSYDSATKLYDYIPGASAGLPQTALCHGLKLFAESRGYTVATNYTQKIDTLYAGGFTFSDYMTEIDNGSPVMVQIEGHSMVGVGYDATGGNQTVYVHDTWGDYIASFQWGTSYSGMAHRAMTVIHLDPLSGSDIGWGDTGSDWGTGSSWVGGSVPGTLDTADFPSDASIGNQPDVGTGSYGVAGIAIDNSQADYNINGTGSLAVGSDGIGVSGGGTTTIAPDLSLTAAQSWDTGAGTLIIDGLVSGLGDMTKDGTGLLDMNGDNSNSGTTTVADGTLQVDGTTSGQGDYTVQSGATLQGAGTVGLAANGSVTIADGGFLAPGASIGSFIIDGDVDIDGQLDVEMDGGSSTADFLYVVGTLTLGADSILDLDITGTLDANTNFTLVDYNTLSGTFLTVNNLPSTHTLAYGAGSNGSIQLLHTLGVVPEPSTLLLLVIALGALLVRRRRR